MQFVPFAAGMLPEAGALLAQRHRLNRSRLPELPARFEDAHVATTAIKTLLAKPNATGFAALHQGKLLGYLIGEATVQPWARSGYIYLPGYGIAEGENPAILQDLYALLGDAWNQQGYFIHYAYVSVADEAVVEALFNLGFGKERVDALLNVQAVEIPEAITPAGLAVRRAVTEDKPFLASLSDTIWRHQSRAPRWHPMTPEETRKQPQGWAEIADSERDLAFLAFEDQEALGSLVFFVEEEQEDDMVIPPHCRYMTAAATREAARGRGVGTTLTWHGLKQIRAEGAEYCLTNWQSANLLAARFWPRFGFKPVAYRLARAINPAIAWARG